MRIEKERLVEKLKEQSKQYGLECGCIEYTNGRALVEISAWTLVGHIPGLLRLDIMDDYIRISELSINWFRFENDRVIDDLRICKQSTFREHGWRKYDEYNYRSPKGDFEFDLRWIEWWIDRIKEQHRLLVAAGVYED